MVGDGQGLLPHLLGILGHLLDAAGPIQQAEFTVYMQMNKIFGHNLPCSIVSFVYPSKGAGALGLLPLASQLLQLAQPVVEPWLG